MAGNKSKTSAGKKPTAKAKSAAKKADAGKNAPVKKRNISKPETTTKLETTTKPATTKPAATKSAPKVKSTTTSTKAKSASNNIIVPGMIKNIKIPLPEAKRVPAPTPIIEKPAVAASTAKRKTAGPPAPAPAPAVQSLPLKKGKKKSPPELQPDYIIDLKRKLHREVFERCLEKKMLQDLDFWND
jgi:hypothetical protein